MLFIKQKVSNIFAAHYLLFKIRCHLTSCPVTVYTFSPRRMKIWPLRLITYSCSGNDANECVLFLLHQK